MNTTRDITDKKKTTTTTIHVIRKILNKIGE